jgi:hypothetical protein
VSEPSLVRTKYYVLLEIQHNESFNTKFSAKMSITTFRVIDRNPIKCRANDFDKADEKASFSIEKNRMKS